MLEFSSPGALLGKGLSGRDNQLIATLMDCTSLSSVNKHQHYSLRRRYSLKQRKVLRRVLTSTGSPAPGYQTLLKPRGTYTKFSL